MNPVVTAAVSLVGLLLALWSVVSAVRDRGPSDWQNRASFAYEAALLLLVVSGLVALLLRVPDDLGLYLGYCAIAVLVQPAVLLLVPAETPRAGSWRLALALFAAAVVVQRLQTTWETGHLLSTGSA